MENIKNTVKKFCNDVIVGDGPQADYLAFVLFMTFSIAVSVFK